MLRSMCLCSCLSVLNGVLCCFLYCCYFPQVWSSREPHHDESDLHPQVLYPWRNPSKGIVRVKRDWIIPPIRVLENSKQVPEDLVQVNMTNLSHSHLKCLQMPRIDRFTVCILTSTSKKVFLRIFLSKQMTNKVYKTVNKAI